jgi:hypothetical protein
VVGFAATAYGVVALSRRAVRRRRYLDILLAVVAAGAVIALLVAHGDRLLQ